MNPFLFFRIVGNNTDYEIHARFQSQQHKNSSIHWTHQFAVLDRVQDPQLVNQGSQKLVSEIQLGELLPDNDVQALFIRKWAVIVSRVITKYLPAFQQFQNVVVRHIPHQYSKDMSQKSNCVSLYSNSVIKINTNLNVFLTLSHKKHFAICPFIFFLFFSLVFPWHAVLKPKCFRGDGTTYDL